MGNCRLQVAKKLARGLRPVLVPTSGQNPSVSGGCASANRISGSLQSCRCVCVGGCRSIEVAMCCWRVLVVWRCLEASGGENVARGAAGASQDPSIEK